MKPTTTKPSQLELQVLGVLWDCGEATARQILEALPDGKPRAYTTVLSVLQVMEKKHLLKRKSNDVTHVWRPAVTRRQIMGPMLSGLLNSVFGGRPAAVLQQLLSHRKVSEDELAEIRRVLDDHSKRERNGKS